MQPKVPILFIISGRPEAAVESFQAVRRYRPERLYVAACGPSPGQEARELILGQVGWPCDVRQLPRSQGAGRERCVDEAVSWMFEREEYGVVVEDDRAPSDDFLRFCEETLPPYSSNGREDDAEAGAALLGRKTGWLASVGA
jgi:hypothetical protein